VGLHKYEASSQKLYEGCASSAWSRYWLTDWLTLTTTCWLGASARNWRKLWGSKKGKQRWGLKKLHFQYKGQDTLEEKFGEIECEGEHVALQ
jgi:hypothetical protein